MIFMPFDLYFTLLPVNGAMIAGEGVGLHIFPIDTLEVHQEKAYVP